MIKINHLQKRFGNLQVLKSLDAEIGDAEIVSLIGRPGCGKSTLLRCLNRLIEPDDGTIEVDGENLSAPVPPEAVRRKIGLVLPQTGLISHLTVIENLMFGPELLLRRSRQLAYDNAIRLLENVGLGGKAFSYPGELAPGQRQRAAIARALAMEPETLLLDDPTSGLDPMTVSEVLTVIRGLAGNGLAMVIATPDMRFAREISNRVFFMDDGVILEAGTPDEIFNAPQRDATANFIRRGSMLNFAINAADFDIYRLKAQLEEFAARRLLAPRQRNTLLLTVEELTVNMLLPHVGELRLGIGDPDADGAITMLAEYAAPAFNPMVCDDEAGMLSRKIVQKRCKSIDHHLVENGDNQLVLIL